MFFTTESKLLHCRNTCLQLASKFPGKRQCSIDY